ncbi:MAG: hypothetical protein JWM85_2499 [Acidimicrobiaceae bacterium]|nr:hypothetical protein [Acidimicrobiaceae bacterium]
MLDAVERAGETPPTNDQLKRWRGAGLLPRPPLKHQAGLRGSQSWYPAWAAEQLPAIGRCGLTGGSRAVWLSQAVRCVAAR